VFVTSANAVCPQCVRGRCSGGANDGGACTPDARVPAGRIDDPPLDVSEDCPPSGSPAGSLVVNLPITTDASVLEDEACDGAAPGCSCGATCTGSACAFGVVDSATGAFICVDARGGV